MNIVNIVPFVTALFLYALFDITVTYKVLTVTRKIQKWRTVTVRNLQTETVETGVCVTYV